MRLIVLGSGSCELRQDRFSPAYLLECGQTRLLLDMGRGALSRLMECGRDPGHIQAVALSHHHPDHLGDLIPYLFALAYDPALAGGPMPRLLAHPQLAQVLGGLQSAFGHWLSPPGLQLEPLVSGDAAEVGPVGIQVCVAAHIGSSLAWRFTAGGRSLVYLGDSQASDELARFAAGADLLVAHCAATDQRPKPGHLSPTACGELAARCGARGLLLSHFYREVDPEGAVPAASRAYGGPVLAAADLMTIEIGPDGPAVAT